MKKGLTLSFSIPILALGLIFSNRNVVLNSLYRVMFEMHGKNREKGHFNEDESLFMMILIIVASVVSFNFGLFMGGWMFDTETRRNTRKVSMIIC